jgi:hypothetical protein
VSKRMRQKSFVHYIHKMNSIMPKGQNKSQIIKQLLLKL